MSTSDIPRHDSVVNGHVGIVSTQPSTPPLTQKPAPALTSQQAPKPVQSGSRSQSQNSSVTETGDSDDEGSDLELDDNDVHFCQRVRTPRPVSRDVLGGIRGVRAEIQPSRPFPPPSVFFLADLHNLKANSFSLAVLRPLPSSNQVGIS